MSHNDTWMPLYIGDYLGDTMELDGPQHGAYLLLLMYYWRNGPLPLEDARLAQIARTDPRVWRKTVGPAIRPFFYEQDGRLHQKRCDLELAKAQGISSKRSSAAHARWNGHEPPPPDGSKTDANADANADASVVHMEVQTPSKYDANDMLRARGLPSQSQSQKEPPRSPPVTGGVARRRRNSRNAFHDLAREMDAEAGITIDGTAEVFDFPRSRGIGHG